MSMIMLTAAPTTQPATRRPRFRRHDPPPFRLTVDDLSIIRHVGSHRFLRSTHLIQLIGRPADKVLRRLSALFHHGYLDRPRAQLDYLLIAGSAPLIYALGNKGAALYAQFDGVDLASVDWTDKNRGVGRPYLDHALMIAEFMIALECSVRSRADFKLLSAREIVADAASMIERANASRTLTASVPGEADGLSVTPDKVFGLEFAATGRRNYFCLEADRSTMPITRRTLAQSSFRKKLLVYHHAHQAKRHIAQWGIPGFRVLTIAKSAERIASMIEVVAEITAGKGSNVFLFADTNMASSVDPFATVWITGKGHRTQLVE